MKVTILYQYLQGQDEPGHSLVLAFAQFLRRKGEQVVVVSGEYGYMHPRKVALPLWRRIVRRESVDGVPVIRTYTAPYGHGSLSGRVLSFLSFSATSFLGLFRGPRPDIVYASTPPLLPMFSAWIASRLRGAALILEVRDLWPASVIGLANVKSRTLTRLMSWCERFLYDRADHIVALTEGIRRDIVGRGWPPEKVRTVRSGVSSTRFFPDEKSGAEVRAREGWGDDKIVIYLGAHGRANNLDVLLRAASRLKSRKDIRFVLVGDGLEKQRLIETARAMDLGNLAFHPPVPAREVAAYINSADLCVVTLKNIPLFEGAVPTKLIEYLACGKPVVIGARGEAESIVTGAAAGLACGPDDDEELAGQIEQLLDDPQRRARMGRGGCEYVRRHYALEQNHAALHELLVAAANARRSGA